MGLTFSKIFEGLVSALPIAPDTRVVRKEKLHCLCWFFTVFSVLWFYVIKETVIFVFSRSSSRLYRLDLFISNTKMMYLYQQKDKLTFLHLLTYACYFIYCITIISSARRRWEFWWSVSMLPVKRPFYTN